MNSEQIYYNRNQSLKNVILFLKSLLWSEISKLEQKDDFLDDSINNMVTRGYTVPEDIGVESQTTKKFGDKVFKEYEYIEDLEKKMNYILSNPYTTQEQKFNYLSNLLGPLFNEHTNVYAGYKGTGTILPGDSHFKSIVSLSDKYGKISNKVQALQQAIQNMRIRGQMNGINKASNTQIEFEHRVNYLNRKKCTVMDKQKIIMIKREQAINKKNKLISNLEGKAMDSYYRGEPPKKYNFYMNAANNLKNIPIVMLAPAPVLLFKEAVISVFTKSRLKYGLYDNKRRMDRRSWATRRREELEESIHKKL